jgi:hypothetical protein
VTDLRFPERWQPEAIEAVAPYVDDDVRLAILVGEPGVSLHGSLLEGFLFAGDDGTVRIIHDRSGRPDVYPWDLLLGPVLSVDLLRPRRPRRRLYTHPSWTGPRVPR